MAQCFKNKLINKSETLLEEKGKYIHHDLKKNKTTPSKSESSMSIISLTYKKHIIPIYKSSQIDSLG